MIRRLCRAAHRGRRRTTRCRRSPACPSPRARCRRRSSTSALRHARARAPSAAARTGRAPVVDHRQELGAQLVGEVRVAHEHVGLARHQQRIRDRCSTSRRSPSGRRSPRPSRAGTSGGTPGSRCRRRGAGRTARATRSAAACTRPAPAAAASPRRRARAAAISARRKRMPGKKYALAIRISRFARADRRRGRRARCRGDGAGCRGSRTSRSACRRGATSIGVGKQRHVAASANWTSSFERPHALHRLHDRREQRALARAPRSRRAAACWPGVFMSSMRLMPPTNATVPSTWHELAVQAAQPVRAELPGRDLGPVLEQAARRRRRSALLEPLRQVVLRAPAVDEHAHDDAALRGAHAAPSATTRPAASSAKMYVSSQTSRSRGVDRRDQRREVLAAAAQQVDARCPGVKRFIDARPRASAACAAARTWPRARRGRTCGRHGNA